MRYVTLLLHNPRNRWIDSPLCAPHKVVPRAIMGTLSDEIDVSAFTFYEPKAVEFSDDQKTMPTNYGYRIRNFQGIDQIQQVLGQLRKDSATRRAVIHVHAVDDTDRKYNPCINSIHFLIRNEKLECHTFWRSENALTLLPVNLFEFTLLQELIASELEISPGVYAHTVTSLHYYLDDEERFQATRLQLKQAHDLEPMPPMPFYSLAQVAILRKYEQKLRFAPRDRDTEKEYDLLFEYWQNLGDTFEEIIQKKSGAPIIS